MTLMEAMMLLRQDAVARGVEDLAVVYSLSILRLNAEDVFRSIETKLLQDKRPLA